MAFIIRGKALIKGGIIQLGPDVELRRQSADLLRTPDSLEVGGSARFIGAVTLPGGTLTNLHVSGTAHVLGDTTIGSGIIQAAGAGSANFGGTPFNIPYATASPTQTQDGQVDTYHKSNVSYLVIRAGGTSYALGLPSATHGTFTVSVDSIP